MTAAQDPARPPRVLHLVSSLEVGGKERVVLDLAQRARARGLDHRLLLFDAPPRASGVDFDPGEVPWTFVPRGPGLDLGFARRVRALVRAEGIDVVHAHNDTAIFYAALADLPTARARLCGTFHTRPGHDTPMARRLTRWATRRHAEVVAVSDDLAEVLVDLGWSRRPRVVWNGVDLERFRPVARRPPASGPLRVATLARADPIKRAGDLVAAARLLRQRGIDVHLTLAGDGPRRGELEDLTARDDAIEVLPRVVDVAAFLAQVDVFALVSDHEAAPRALLEAMACGLACCVTEVGGMPAMLTTASGERAGRLVPPRDPAALADALADLAGAPGDRARLGALARERAEDFSDEAMWARYAALWSGATPQEP